MLPGRFINTREQELMWSVIAGPLVSTLIINISRLYCAKYLPVFKSLYL